MSPEQLSELQAKHKRVAHLVSSTVNDDGSPEWEVVLRRPTRHEYKHYRSQCHDSARISDAQEELVRKLMVVPSGEAITTLIDDWPGIPEACGAAIAKLAGMSGQESAK